MTKTLTEQWKDGTLEQKYYYVKFNCKPKPFVEIELKNFLLDLVKVKDRDNIEVLAPVPNYEEWQAELDSNNELLNVQKRLEKKIKLLEEQLNCALETMGQVAKLSDNTVDSVQCAHAICLINERLKEMEGVK